MKLFPESRHWFGVKMAVPKETLGAELVEEKEAARLVGPELQGQVHPE
jgi:hypothetical protein